MDINQWQHQTPYLKFNHWSWLVKTETFFLFLNRHLINTSYQLFQVHNKFFFINNFFFFCFACYLHSSTQVKFLNLKMQTPTNIYREFMHRNPRERRKRETEKERDKQAGKKWWVDRGGQRGRKAILCIDINLWHQMPYQKCNHWPWHRK